MRIPGASPSPAFRIDPGSSGTAGSSRPISQPVDIYEGVVTRSTLFQPPPPPPPPPPHPLDAELRDWVSEDIHPDELGAILDGTHPELVDWAAGGLTQAQQRLVIDAAVERWVPAEVTGFNAMMHALASVDDPALLGYAAERLYERSQEDWEPPPAVTIPGYAAAAARVAAADPEVARAFLDHVGTGLPDFVAALSLGDESLPPAGLYVAERADAAATLLSSVSQDPIGAELAGQLLDTVGRRTLLDSAPLQDALEAALAGGADLFALTEVFDELTPKQIFTVFSPYAQYVNLPDARLHRDHPDAYLMQLQSLDLLGRIEVSEVAPGTSLELPPTTTRLFPQLLSDPQAASVLSPAAWQRWQAGTPTIEDLTSLIDAGVLDPGAMIASMEGAYRDITELSPSSVANGAVETVAAGIIELTGGIESLEYAQSTASHIAEMFAAEGQAVAGADAERQAEILFGAMLRFEASSQFVMPRYQEMVAREGERFLQDYYGTLQTAASITTELGTYVFAAAALSAGIPPAVSTATFRASMSMIFDAAFQQAQTGSLDAESWLRVGAGNFVQGYFAALPIGQGGNAAAWASRHLSGLNPRTAALVGNLFAGVFATTSSTSGGILGSWIIDPELMPTTPEERRQVLTSLAASAASGLLVQGPLNRFLQASGYPGLANAIGDVEQETLQNVMVSTAENLAAGMSWDEAIAAAVSLDNNAESILIAAILGPVTSGVGHGDSQILTANRAQQGVDNLLAAGGVVLPHVAAEIEARLGLQPGTLQVPSAYSDQTLTRSEIDATLARLGLANDPAFRARMERIVTLTEDAHMTLGQIGTTQATAVSLLAEEYGIDVSVVGRLSDDPMAVAARAEAVVMADAVVAGLGIEGISTLQQLKDTYGLYPASVIQQGVAFTLRQQGVMIEPWQVKVSSGASEVDAVVPREQWQNLDLAERAEVTAAMQRIFGVQDVDWYQDIQIPPPEVLAEQWARAGIQWPDLVSSFAAATGQSPEQLQEVLSLPNYYYHQPPGTSTFNSIDFYSNGDVLHTQLAGESQIVTRASPAPRGRPRR